MYTNRKSRSKTAFVSRLMALAMCCTTLLGSTYAWFTATTTTNVNKIVSGTLDVQLVDAAGNDLEGETMSFKNKDGSTTILWEPNATFALDDVYVKNNGNLAMKYRIEINEPEGVPGAVNLQDVIDFSVFDGTQFLDLATYENHLSPNEKSGALSIRGHMRSEAGNEYMNQTLENVSITIYATQYTEEYDSFDNIYDANAEYGIESAPVSNNGYVTLDNLIIDVDKYTGEDAVTVTGGRTIIEGGYYDAGQTPFGGVGNTAVFATAGEVVINDGTFFSDGLAVLEDGTVDAGHIDLIYAKGGAQITINGGFFSGADETVWLLNCADNSGSTITVNGGTFVNWNPAEAQTGAGEIVVNGTVSAYTQSNGDVWYMVG